MLNELRIYVYGVLAALGLFLVGIFKYRGEKIKALKKDVETERKNAETHEEEVKKVIAELQLQEKYNEIDKDIIKSGSDTNRDRLSQFNRS